MACRHHELSKINSDIKDSTYMTEQNNENNYYNTGSVVCVF